MRPNAEQKVMRIAAEFACTPGARNTDEGAYSGEEFLKRRLLPAFKEIVQQNGVLLIDLDNTEGYATSFLEEAFGGLSRLYDARVVLKHLEFKSSDEPLLIDEIKMYISQAKATA
jgi:hypothetical protein